MTKPKMKPTKIKADKGPASWSDKQLMDEAQELYDVIYNVTCYGVRDLQMFDIVVSELGKRGYEMKEQVAISFTKQDESED